MFILEKKIICVFIFLFQYQFMISQKKEVTVYDKETNLPIENANVYYPELNEGTFTNSEGKALINVKKLDLKISNIGYEDVIILYKEINNTEKVILTPKSIQLDEVVINSFNLKKAISYVIDNYSELYVNIPFEKECDFKETVSIDNQLKRLILTKVNWWGKSYERKKINDLKLRLGAIDYNKNEPLDIFRDVPRLNNESKSGYVVPNSLINTLYLNTFLASIKNFAETPKSKVEESPSNQIIVSFESNWKLIKDISIRTFGKITFDKETKAIVEFIYDIEFKNNIARGIVEENKKESISETKKSAIKLNFYKAINNKWSIKSFETKVDLSITYDNKTHDAIFKNNIYVLKETAVKKVNDNGLIDLTKPIYQNLPTNTITNSNSILLSEDEKEFVFSTK